MSSLPPRIYLDNAATSWPKPDLVYEAVDRYQRENGAAAGRGVTAEASEVARLVSAARSAVANLLGVRDARRIIFTLNGTDSLNLALHGTLAGGGHVVTTVAEHNSVLRPLRQLEEWGGFPTRPKTDAKRTDGLETRPTPINVSRVACGADGLVDPDAIRRAMRPDTRLVAITHASNVTGAIQPVAEIVKIAHEHGALCLVDAAQTAGEVSIDVEQLGVDLLASPGHKGLLGPLGTGVLYVRPGAETQLQPVRQGGTGSRSEEDRQPEALPDRYESGNLNVPGIVGLGAGVAWLAERGLDNVRAHAIELTGRLLTGLRDIPGVQLYGPETAADRVGIVSMTLAGFDPQEVALALDTAYRVQTRPGLHCAPLMHRALGTLEAGGTVRFSPGPFTTTDDIDTAIVAVAAFAIV